MSPAGTPRPVRLAASLAALASASLLLLHPASPSVVPDAAALATAEAPPAGECGADSRLCEAAGRWEAFWQDREQGTAPAIQTVNGIPMARVVATGDTVWMRYPGLWPRDAEHAQLRFQQVALAGNIERMRALLQLLAADAHPVVAYRARLELARAEWRAGRHAAAADASRQALALGGLADELRTDASLVLGMAELALGRPGAAEEALDQAIRRDAAHWNAHWVLLEVLTRRLAQAEPDPAACLDRTRRLLETLALLPRLALDVTQFRDLAVDLERVAARRTTAGWLAIGAAWLWAGELERGRAALEAAERIPSLLPPPCEALLRERARLLAVERPRGGI